MKNKSIFFTLLLITNFTFSQIINIDYSNVDNDKFDFINDDSESTNAEFFDKGYLDFFGSGNIQASAQLIKLNIGEPDKFQIPFYLFLSASGNSFGDGEQNKNTIDNLLNPIGGIFNGTINKSGCLYETGKYTFLKFNFQLSAKLLNGNTDLENENKLFFAGYSNAGLFFQTGAWVDEDKSNIGIFWMQAKLTSSFANKEDLIDLFGVNLTENNFFGYSLDLGIEIDNKIDLKAGVYQYWGNEAIDNFNKPIIKFSIDHNF